MSGARRGRVQNGARARSLFYLFSRRADYCGAGQFNVLWLNPEVPESFPPGMLDALGDDAYTLAAPAVRQRALEDVQARLRASMQAHALQPLQPMGTDDDGAPERPDLRKVGEAFSEEDVEDAREFLRCDVSGSLPSFQWAVALMRRTGTGAAGEGAAVPAAGARVLFLVRDAVCELGRARDELSGGGGGRPRLIVPYVHAYESCRECARRVGNGSVRRKGNVANGGQKECQVRRE